MNSVETTAEPRVLPPEVGRVFDPPSGAALAEGQVKDLPYSKLRAAEDWLLTFALAAMILLPLVEMALRAFFHTGLAGSSTLVQHLTLVVSMAGGALATRDDRLIAFSTLPALMHGAWAARARWFSYTVAATVAATLGVAGAQFVAAERAAARPFLFGVPLWAVEFVLPLGFAVIAGRLIFHAAPTWRGRVLSGVGVAGMFASGVWSPLAASTLVWPAAALLSAAAVLGAPVFVLLGGVGLALFWANDLPIASMPVEH